MLNAHIKATARAMSGSTQEVKVIQKPSAVNLFLRQAIRRQGLPFEVLLSGEEVAAEATVSVKKLSGDIREYCLYRFRQNAYSNGMYYILIE